VGADTERDPGELSRGDRRHASGSELGPVGIREVKPADMGIAGRLHTAHTWRGALAGLGRCPGGTWRAGRAIVGFTVARRASASSCPAAAAAGTGMGRGARGPARSRRSRA
jgi:hypothetical protein